MNKYDNARIENGKVYGITFKTSWTCQLPNGDKVSVSPDVDLNGISLDTFVNIFIDNYKVKANTQLKKLTADEINKAFVNKSINWATMINAQAAKDEVGFVTMTKEEQLAEIARLTAIVEASNKR